MTTGKRHSMVRWYDPVLLAQTGLRATISTAVGQVADNREVHAALTAPPKVFDHSKDSKPDEDFWFDFVADMGDGWQATNAVARAICQESVTAGDLQIPRGTVLVMGGDEVYPTPSRQAYRERTIAPWNEAAEGIEPFETELYALPGNHDWYDGLHAFTEVFCRGDRQSTVSVGESFDCLKTVQTHSYFALKLQQGWWLCGIDIALNDQIDKRQNDFFFDVAKQIKPGDKLILCAPTPSWIKQARGTPGATDLLDNMSALLTANGGELRVVLTGDQHHYARYGAGDKPVTLITAGGGGAFMHPTHKLPDSVTIKPDGQTTQRFAKNHCYPSAQISAKITWKNLLFPFNNQNFALACGLIYLLLVWFLETRSLSPDRELGANIIEMMQSHISITDTLIHFFRLIPRSPEFAIIVAMVAAALIAFNVTQNRLARVSVGLLHTLLHITGLVMAYCIAILFLTLLPESLQTRAIGFPAFIVTLFVTGSILGGLIFGAYLIFSLNVLGWQWTNAFSALRIADYKNFLRLKISPDGALTIYPIGIDDVSAQPIQPHLIEEPVVIK